MTGLLIAEVWRLVSRRLFRVIALAVFVGVIVIAAIVAVRSSNDPESGMAEARALLAECRQNEQKFHLSEPCPSVDELQQRFSRRFDYAASIPNAVQGVAIALLALSFVVGGSFVGAEWGSGSMTTMLTWEPRRGRLLAAKAAACALVVAVFAVLVLAFISVVFLPIGALRGTTAGLDGAVWRTITGTWGRGAAIAAFGSFLGVGLATLFRNTAGAVGTGFFYMAIADPLLATLWHARFRIWTLQHLIPRMLALPVEVPRAEQPAGSGVLSLTSTHLSATRPAILLTIYAAALLAIAYASLRARDVT